MQRRTFLHLAGGAALASCARGRAPISAAPASGVGAIAFDLFTLFDPRTVDRRVVVLLPGVDGGAFATAWKSRLFQSSWLRAAAGRYAPFDELVVHALDQTAAAFGVSIAAARRDELVGAFTALEPWPDTDAVLRRLRARGVRLATLANFAPSMISALLASGRITDLFEHQLSTDAARTYKPDPHAYALAERAFALPRQQVAFAAFGPWDADGAAWFGLPTFWVNRLGLPAHEVAAPNVTTGANLDALLAWSTT